MQAIARSPLSARTVANRRPSCPPSSQRPRILALPQFVGLTRHRTHRSTHHAVSRTQVKAKASLRQACPLSDRRPWIQGVQQLVGLTRHRTRRLAHRQVSWTKGRRTMVRSRRTHAAQVPSPTSPQPGPRAPRRALHADTRYQRLRASAASRLLWERRLRLRQKASSREEYAPVCPQSTASSIPWRTCWTKRWQWRRSPCEMPCLSFFLRPRLFHLQRPNRTS
mmetsp:Transcript_89452/g.251951  ORF Transcript_89452/g.251951 Transcript_89452/m.251951 type:complete len:223 (-) Transcript_89452:528-1196(-)